MNEEKIDAIVNVLPHGSGINYDWEITTKGKDYIYITHGITWMKTAFTMTYSLL